MLQSKQLHNSELAFHNDKVANLSIDEQTYQRFWDFLYERQLVWYKRNILKEPFPWTEDPVLLKYKFTNIYRELDTGTQYMFDNVLGKTDDLSIELFNIILYRTYNLTSTWDHIGFVYDFEKQKDELVATLDNLQSSGITIWTSAHMVPPYRTIEGATKTQRMVKNLLPIWRERQSLLANIQSCQDLKSIFKHFVKLLQYGPFLAYELTTDVTYTNITTLSEDDYWANPGPGCKRGIKWIFPKLKDLKPTTKDFEDCIIRIRNDQFTRLREEFQEIAFDNKILSMRNIEHSLCEFDKYNRTVVGFSKPKQLYHIRTGENE